MWRVAVPFVLLAALSVACKEKKVVTSFPDAFVGVGVELTLRDHRPVVVRVIAGSSAAEAGVLPGDLLLAVDGVPTQGKSLGDVVMSVRGRPESQVTLTLQRQDQRHVVVVRRRTMSKSGSDYQRN
jgi:carboxyl-terminal processing protease